MSLAALAFISCEADTEPVLQTPTEFKLNTPPFVNQLYDLSPEGVMELTVSQPNYGLTLAPAYNAEVSFYPDFGASQPAVSPDDPDYIPYSIVVAPANPFSAVMSVSENDLAIAMCELRGITEKEDYTDQGPVTLYVRVIAQVAESTPTRIVSNTVTFPQVQGYFASSAKLLDVLYTPGVSNGWNHVNSQWLENYDEGLYHGFVYISGAFKFTDAPNWNGTNYGTGDAAGELSTDGGAKDLAMPAEGEGLYYAEVNVTELTYTLTYISSVGIVGGFNNWTEKAPAEMTSDDYLHWTYTGDINSTEFKFNFNHAWAISLGGAIDELEFGGANLTDDIGATTVTLDLSKLPYKATLE